METRKVQRVSNGTYTVSLPKRWAESEGVTAGTVVDIRTHIDGLLDARDRVREEAETLDRRLFEAPDADYRLTDALDGVRRTAEHAGNVAEVGLRTAIRDGDPPETPTDGGLGRRADGDDD